MLRERRNIFQENLIFRLVKIFNYLIIRLKNKFIFMFFLIQINVFNFLLSIILNYFKYF
jgi:hypothetical protein